MPPPTTTGPSRRRDGARAVAAVSGSLSIGVLPVFLVGALSDRIGDDLGFGAGGTGVMVALFFSAAGLAAIPLGMVSDRIGARRGLRLGIVVSAGAAGAAGMLAGSVWHLAVAMVIGGSVIGLIDTGAARLITGVLDVDRHGVAFGIKEASVPAASMIAGGSIPLVAEAYGWRPVFAAGAVLAPLLWFLLPEPREPAAVTGRSAAIGDEEAPATPSLVVFATGVALSVGAATAAATFLVPAVTATSEASDDVAGVVLAVASVASITTRVAVGIVSDRHPASTATVMAGAMGIGAVGAALLTFGGPTGLVVVGALLVLGAGWGWTGLAFLAAVRATPDTPSTAAGVVLTGLSAGGVGGPALYGGIVSVVSYEAAWGAVAVALVAGAMLIRHADI